MPLEKYIIDKLANNSITPADLMFRQLREANVKELAEALNIKGGKNAITTSYYTTNKK